MGFYDDFEGRRSGVKSFFLVLLGAVLGTALTLAIFMYAGPGFGIESPFPDPGPGLPDNPAPDFVLPEYQNTAVVRAAQKVTPAVVGVSNRRMVTDWFRGSSQLREVGTGSGVVIDATGFIVTNYHVIADATEVVVTFSDGEEVTAEIVGADAATDLAVLKVDKTGLTAASFGDSEKLKVGEMAIAIGNPLGLAFQQSVTFGVISATERFIETAEHRFGFIQTDAAINPGNSGGALVNLQGEVVGINTAKINLPGFEGMGFAIPSNMVKDTVNELVEHGRVIRPWIGVFIDEVTPAKAETLGLPVTSGVIIVEIITGGPAQKAGLKVDDIIISLGEGRVADFESLRRAIFAHKPGDTVDVVVLREGQEVTVPVILGELPQESN